MVKVLTKFGTYDYVKKDLLKSFIKSGYVVAVVE